MQIIYNGRPLVDLEGYTTANIEGRGLLHRVFSSIDVPGRDGEYIIDQRLPARHLIVHFRMLADNATEFLERINQLHDALKSDEDVLIQCSDENYYRYGRYAEAEAPPYDSYRGFGSYTLKCQDPYKYRDLAAVTGADITIPSGAVYPFRIRSIMATITTARTGFTITNVTTGRKIILTGEFATGQVLTLQPEDGRILLNGQNIMSRLDHIASDWHTFEIYSGDRITAPQAITLNLSERAL